MKTQNENSYYLVKKLFWQVFPIQALIASVGAINAVIDGVIGSRFLGAEAMAAVGLFSPVTIIFDGIVGVLAIGGLMVIVQYMGKTEKAKASQVFSLVSVILVAIGLILGIGLSLCSQPLSSLLKGNDLLRMYIIGYCVFLFARMLSTILTDTLQVIGQSRRSMIAVLVMACANVGLDILLVCVFDMGILGLGLATGLSYVAQTLVLLPPYLKKDCLLKFSMGKLQARDLLDVIKFGLPSALGQFTISIKGFAQNYTLMYLGGTMAVAASSVQGTFCWLMATITIGGGQTTLILMSLYISEEDRLSMRNVLSIILRNTLVMGAIAMVIVIGLAGPIGNMYYGNEPEALAYTISALRIFPLFMLPNIAFYVLLRVYQSEGKKALSYILSLSENLVIMAFIVALGFAFGINGAWAGLPVGSLVLVLITLSVGWLKNKKISFRPDDLLLLDDDFGVSEEDRMERTIYTMDNAIGLSEDVVNFCKSHGIDNRTAMVSGLSVEELSIIMFKYSLAGVKNAQADVRILAKDRDLILRLRDNGKPIFVEETVKINDPEDPSANIGLKMIAKMNADVTANSIMGLNVVTVVIPREN